MIGGYRSLYEAEFAFIHDLALRLRILLEYKDFRDEKSEHADIGTFPYAMYYLSRKDDENTMWWVQVGAAHDTARKVNVWVDIYKNGVRQHENAFTFEVDAGFDDIIKPVEDMFDKLFPHENDEFYKNNKIDYIGYNDLTGKST